MVAGALSSLLLVLAVTGRGAGFEPPAVAGIVVAPTYATTRRVGLDPPSIASDTVVVPAETATDVVKEGGGTDGEEDGGSRPTLRGQLRQRYESAQQPGFGFDGAANFAPQKRAVTLAELVQKMFHRGFIDLQFLSELGI